MAEGDLVVADADGVVVVPAARATEVSVRSHQRDRAEAETIRRLRAGETTLAIYRLPGEQG